MGEVEEIFNFERVFLEYWLWVCCFFGYVLVKFLQLWILIHLFSKTLQFWAYAQFFSSYQRANARCMYISHRKNTTFSFRVRRWNKDLTSPIVLILCPYNLFCHHFFVGTKSVFISWNFFSIATFWKYVYLFIF